MTATHLQHVALLRFAVDRLEQRQVSGDPPRGHGEDAVVAAQGDEHHGVPGLTRQQETKGHVTVSVNNDKGGETKQKRQGRRSKLVFKLQHFAEELRK